MTNGEIAANFALVSRYAGRVGSGYPTLHARDGNRSPVPSTNLRAELRKAMPNTYEEAVDAARTLGALKGHDIATFIVGDYGLRFYPKTAELIYEGLSTDDKLILSLLPTASEVDPNDWEVDFDVPAHDLLDKEPLYDIYVNSMRDACKSYLLQLSNMIRKGPVNA